MRAKANIPQGQFLAMPHKYRAMVTGYGAGKTWVGSMAMGIHYLEHPGINQGYFAPTYPHIRDIFFPTIEEAVFDLGLSVDIKESNKEVHFYSGRQYRGTTICRSMEKPHQIIGFKIGHAMIDEIDVLPTDKATLAWRKIIARMRYNVPGVKNGIDITTTPEGFKFTHKTFVENPNNNTDLKVNYGLIQASTYANAKNLPDDYIPALKEAYPAELIEAYINGQFVNLTAGTVYRNFDRVRCGSTETIKDNEVLNIGMDFNVGNMAATIFVDRESGWHAVDELKEIFDTPDIIKKIQERYQGHKIKVYPDASGNSRKSVNASTSDLALLRQAGFFVAVNSKNPLVRDRINATNKQFEIGNLWVNAKKCPTVAKCLEQQSYDPNGEPDKKGGFDHQNDSFSYPVVYEFPINKPVTTSQTVRL
jgi:hypothetical protein